MFESLILSLIEKKIIVSKTIIKQLLSILAISNSISSSMVLFLLDISILIKVWLFPSKIAEFSSENAKTITNAKACKRKIERSTIFRKVLPILMATNNKLLISDVIDCSTLLFEHSSKEDGPVIFMPLHLLSDTVAMLTVVAQSNKHCNVIMISDNDKDELSKSKMYKLHVDNKLTRVQVENNDHKPLINALSKSRSGSEYLIIYPDILPEYTKRQVKGSLQKYLSVNIFGKESLMHEGPISISKMTSATVIPFYIYEEKSRIKIRLFSKVAGKDISEKMPKIIESALTEKSEQWMLWHYLSFFYYKV